MNIQTKFISKTWFSIEVTIDGIIIEINDKQPLERVISSHLLKTLIPISDNEEGDSNDILDNDKQELKALIPIFKQEEGIFI